MSRTHLTLAVGLALVAGTARADGVPFRFERAIYVDEKDAPLLAPEGVACSDTAALVVADTGNGRLVFYTHRDGMLSGGRAVAIPQVTYPTRVQFDSKGNVVVLDQKARKIVRLDANGNLLAVVEVTGAKPPAAVFPGSFKVDPADGIHLLDVAGGRVLSLDPTGKVIREIPLPPGKAGFSDLHVDSAGTIYAVDGVSAQVWAVDKASGAFKPFTPPMKDKMGFPTYMTGSRGRLFLVDQNGNGIVALGSDGSYLGRSLSIGWSEGFVYYPAQLCVTGSGDGYLADRGNNRVQVFAVGK